MHWTRRVGLLCLCLAVFAATRGAHGQQVISTSAGMVNTPAGVVTPSGTVLLDNFSGSMALTNDGGTYLLFHKMIGDGVGFQNGFQRIGLRAKVYDWGDSHLFGEFHTLITDSSRIGINTGGGYRWLYDDGIAGVHAWYDNYESNAGFRYQQIAFGAEYLHPAFDFRANGYVPIGERQNFLQVVNPGNQTIFFQNTIGTVGTGLFERSLTGFDMEGGLPFPVVNWLRGYAGTYYLNAHKQNTWGFRGRVEARVAQGVNLNFMVTDDNFFGTNLNLGVTVLFSGGMPTKFGQSYSTPNRRYDQVFRNWPIQLTRQVDRTDVPLINPLTGQNFRIVWVDNRAAAGGNGTFERPFNFLPGKLPNADLVLVRTGNGSTLGNIDLVANQRLLGEGITHTIDTTLLGTIPLPSVFANTGPAPILQATDPDNAVVTLASGTEVSSFTILGGNVAIDGTDVNGFNVNNVVASGTNGLALTNAFGTGILQDVQFTAAGNGTAAAISNTSSTLLSLAIDNLVTRGGAVGTRINADGGDISLNLQDLDGQGHSMIGLNLLASNADLTATVDGAALASLAGSGVVMGLSNATGTTTFTGLDASNNGADGLRAVADAGTNYSLNIIDSNLAGNGDDNIDVTVANQSQLNLLVDPTDASAAVDNNFVFSVAGNSTLDATFQDVDLTDAGNDAINGSVMDGSTLALDVLQSPASGAGNDGINLQLSDGSTGTVTFDGGSLANSGNNALSLSVQNDSDLTLSLTDTPGNANGNIGLLFDIGGGAQGGSTFVANVTNADFSNNPITNIDGTVSGNSQATLNFANVLAGDQAATGGALLDADTGGKITGTWTGGDISNTQGDGVLLTVDGAGSAIDLTFDTVTIDNNAGNGISGVLQNGGAGSNLGIALSNTSVRNNVLNGIDVALDGAGATGTVSFGGVQVTGNGGDGFQFDVTGGAVLTAARAAGGNFFSSNGSNAFQGTVDGAGSKVTLTVDGAASDNSGETGALFNVDDNGQFEFNFDNGSFSNSGGDGLATFVNNGGSAVLNLDTFAANDNVGAGYRFDVNDGSIDVNFSGVVSAQNNGRQGMVLDVSGGSTFSLALTGANLSGNGTAGAFSGVTANVTGAGSSATLAFTDTLINSNTLHGLEFNVDSQGSLIATLASTDDGTLSISNNAGRAVFVDATNADTVDVTMSGNGLFDGNGVNSGPLMSFNINGANEATVGVSGTVQNSADDGVNIAMNNVAQGTIQITGPDTVITGSAGDGIDISLTDSQMASLMIDGIQVLDSTGDGLKIVANNTDLSAGAISNSTFQNNQDGISIQLNNGSNWDLTIGGNRTGANNEVGNNQVLANRGQGIRLTADSGTSTIGILNNDIVSNADNNVLIDFSGSAAVTLNVNGNEIDGNGRQGGFTTGVNFTGSTFSPFFDGFPPDTMGSVGPDHIVEMLNQAFTIYDKSGNVISTETLDQFWNNAGVSFSGFTGDPRIIYDPTVGRWFAISFDLAFDFNGNPLTNSILVAVSNTSDPTQGFTGFSFIGDLNNRRFDDFPTLGIDADALYVGTVNFFPVSQPDFSLFMIPKTDLLGPTPNANNMVRFEGIPNTSFIPTTDPTHLGGVPQAVVDFGPSDGQGIILAAGSQGGDKLERLNIDGSGTTSATISNTIDIGVTPYLPPDGGSQPGAVFGNTLEHDESRFYSNVVKVGNSIWAAHGVMGPGNKDAVRWYEIDATTNQVLQTGTIQDPSIDFLYPSIAVNSTGHVVIGFTMTGNSLNPSSGVATATTVDGVTTFSAPMITQLGGGTQLANFGFIRNRWGDYSATVVDPTNSNHFWTFQEFVPTDDNYAIQITELILEPRSTVTGDTANDGLNLNVTGNAQLLTGSTISNNLITGHATGDGLDINLGGNASAAGLTMDGNTIQDNGLNGLLVNDASTGGITATISNATIERSGNDGIQINKTAGSGANVTITGTAVTDSGNRGIAITAQNQGGGRSIFNIGQTGADRNTISGSVNQNVLLTTTATSISQLDTAANPDVRVDENQNNPPPGAYFDTASRDLVSATFNVVNSDITGSQNSNGLELAIGSSTLMNSQIAGNTFSGNALDDILLRPFVSSTGAPANPPSSFNGAGATDRLVYDPVAHLDLALGAVDTNNDTIPDTTPLATVQNTGETIVVNFTGNSFTNADPFKNDRAVRLAGQVQVMGTLDSNNTFTGVPSVDAIFAGQSPVFNIIPANAFPDTTVP